MSYRLSHGPRPNRTARDWRRGTSGERTERLRHRLVLEVLEDRCLLAIGFPAARNFAAGVRPTSVAVGDFTGDGMLDLATANQGDGDVSVLVGKGDGTFGDPV